MKLMTLVAFVVLALGLSAPALAQDVPAPEPEEAVAEADAEPVAWSPGLLFATDSILLDVRPFNGGAGGVLRSEDTALRGTLGVLGTNSFTTLSAKLGLWYVNYIWTGRISPYWNTFARLDLLSQTTESDPDNWTRDFSLSAAGGLSLGAEFFLLDFLSLFAEYSLSVGVSGTRTVTSAGGTVTPGEFTWTYSAGTDLAHGGAIGITIYFEPQVDLAESDA